MLAPFSAISAETCMSVHAITRTNAMIVAHDRADWTAMRLTTAKRRGQERGNVAPFSLFRGLTPNHSKSMVEM